MQPEVIDLVHQEAHIGPVGKRSIVKLILTNEHYTLLSVEFPIGARPEEHIKPNTETIYVLSGEHVIEFPDMPDKKECRVRAGSAISLPPGVKHRHVNGARETTKILLIASPPGPETRMVQTSPAVDVSKLESH